jgi:hypothetical protein
VEYGYVQKFGWQPDHLVVDKVFIPKFDQFKENNHMTEETFNDCFSSWNLSEEGFTLKTIGNDKEDFTFDFNDCDYDGCGEISQKEFIDYCLKIIQPRVVILKFLTLSPNFNLISSKQTFMPILYFRN